LPQDLGFGIAAFVEGECCGGLEGFELELRVVLETQEGPCLIQVRSGERCLATVQVAATQGSPASLAMSSAS